MWSDWLVVCDCSFSLSALWSPLSVLTVLLGFLLPWMWGLSSGLLQQSAAAAPYLWCGVAPLSRAHVPSQLLRCAVHCLFVSWFSLEYCTFGRICPFLPHCPLHWHIVAYSSLLWSFVFLCSLLWSLHFLFWFYWFDFFPFVSWWVWLMVCQFYLSFQLLLLSHFSHVRLCETP